MTHFLTGVHRRSAAGQPQPCTGARCGLVLDWAAKAATSQRLSLDQCLIGLFLVGCVTIGYLA
jgi:hypothetical protein